MRSSRRRKAELDSVEGKLIAMMGGFLAAEAAGLKVTRFLQNGADRLRQGPEGPASRARSL